VSVTVCVCVHMNVLVMKGCKDACWLLWLHKDQESNQYQSKT